MAKMTSLPPGFRFHPTDDELITFYLTRKVSDVSFICNAIVDVDLNKSEPWDLPGKASIGDKEWYFFNLRDRKYPTGMRTNRATEAGYWKTTGKDKEIFGGGGRILVGMKKTLVFYKGRAPRGQKTNWVMHEYRLEDKHLFNPSSKEEWVVCRVFHKSSAAAKKPQESSSLQQSSGSPCNTNTNSLVNTDFGDAAELSNLNSIIMNSSTASSGFNKNISSQSYNNENNVNVDIINTNLNMNSAATTESQAAPVLWPWSLRSSNLTMRSLILKALQLRSYQQGIMPQFGSSSTDFSSNLHASSSSSKVLESMLQQQLQDQSFDSIW